MFDIRRAGVLALALVAVLALAAGCSDSPSQGVTAAEVDSIVQRITDEAVASDDRDIEGMVARAVEASVERAMMEQPSSPPPMSAEEIQRTVEAAVAAATSEGVTAAQIDSIVGRIIDEAVTSDDRDIEGMVARAVEEAAGDQITAAQVTSIVNALAQSHERSHRGRGG